jgi:4-amino-4-deoxy-L-arabinose transferase-like glycosyltransferase
VATRIDKRDLPWVALIAVSFIFGLAVSWERWGNPLVDCGREMNQPLRLARGEMLYSDVRHIYGPLSPYVNALLYRIFSPSLAVLYADGIVTAMLVLALVYWLARRLMERVPAVAATLSVMWLCAFKQAGNYVLPYSYSALHGCALGLVSLVLLVHFIERWREPESTGNGVDCSVSDPGPHPVHWSLFFAGASTGLAILAKTEMGLAALCAGVITVVLIGSRTVTRVITLSAMFALPAAVLVLGVYGYIWSRVGWHTLAEDSLLFLRHLPPDLVYFNKRVSGFDQPLQSIAQIIGAAVRIASLAAIIATVSLLLTRRKRDAVSTRQSLGDLSVTDAGQASYAQIWLLLAASVLVFGLIPFAGALTFETGPYLAMPLLLFGLIGLELNRARKQLKQGALNSQTMIVLVLAIYALASLARVILRVRSGGAYSSYMLPASVIVFTYAWARPFTELFRDRKAGLLAGNIAIGLILTDVVLTGGLLTYRFLDKNTYRLETDRGMMLTIPDIGQAMTEAIGLIKRETAEGEPVAVMPEGTSLNFYTNRPNPLREEITTPGYLDRDGEERAIRQLIQSNTRLVLVTNRATSEFGPTVFGRDYCQTLMQWIEQNFEECAILGPDHDPNQQIGDKIFFIRAYRKRSV